MKERTQETERNKKNKVVILIRTKEKTREGYE